MKTKNTTLIIACLVLTSCISICGTHIKRRIEPKPVIITSWSQDYFNNVRCYEDFFDRETVDCQTICIVEKDFYIFNVYTKTDTIKIHIHNSYVGSNVDSIYIFIDRTIDTSEIIVHPDCSWIRLGDVKALIGDLRTFNCEVSTNYPVFVNVYLIVNPMIDNVNPSWRDYDKSTMDLFIKSNYIHLDSLIKKNDIE